MTVLGRPNPPRAGAIRIRRHDCGYDRRGDPEKEDGHHKLRQLRSPRLSSLHLACAAPLVFPPASAGTAIVSFDCDQPMALLGPGSALGTPQLPVKLPQLEVANPGPSPEETHDSTKT